MKFIGVFFSAAVGVFAGVLIALDLNGIQDAFLFADPTMGGGLSAMNVRAVLSVLGHGCVILLALHRVISRDAPTAGRLAARLCFGAVMAEALVLTPCLPAADALCGVFYIVLNQVTAPVMIIGFAIHLTQTRSRRLLAITGGLVAATAAGALIGYLHFTPKSAADCETLSGDLRRDNCLANFAARDNDESLCERIDFDSTRWTCLYQIAERKGMPSLCGQVTAPCRFESPGVQCDPETYRDTCYLVVARRLKDAKWCGHVADAAKQENCLKQTGEFVGGQN